VGFRSILQGQRLVDAAALLARPKVAPAHHILLLLAQVSAQLEFYRSGGNL